MTARRIWLREVAMPVGLALLVGLAAPAHAADPAPGKPDGADLAAQVMAGALGGDDSGPGGMLSFALFGVVPLALGAFRLSRGISRASRAITKTGSAVRSSESFEDRLAEKLRELEPKGQPSLPAKPVVASPERELVIAPPPLSVAPRPTAPGPRTFGRRVG